MTDHIVTNFRAEFHQNAPGPSHSSNHVIISGVQKKAEKRVPYTDIPPTVKTYSAYSHDNSQET